MNLLDKVATEFVRESFRRIVGMPESVALCILESLVERGTEELGQKSITEALLCVREECYVTDESFSFSAYIGMLDCARKKDPAVAFVRRLMRIFPDTLMEKIYKLGQDSVKKYNGLSKEEFLARWQKHQENRSRVLQEYFGNVPAKVNPARIGGTATRLVRCPKCKTEKRCDSKTKQFRCKCGFQTAYPFTV